MKIKNLPRLIPATVLTLSSLLTIGVPMAAAAGPYTCTWTGAGTDANFSTAANWSGCNSAAPVAGDNDNLVFDNSSAATSFGDPNNDISGLNVTSITWIN